MWTGPTFQRYYQQIDRITREKLDKEDSEYLLKVDFDEYLDFLIEEAQWQPLEWDETQKTVEAFSAKRQRTDVFGEPYEVEEQFLRLRIPISAHSQLADYFKFGPSTTWMGTREPEWKFGDGVLIHEVEATEQAVQQGVEAVRFWLGNRNKDIEAGNEEMRSVIRHVWETKRKQLEDSTAATNSLLEQLNIPLHQDPHAKVKPIEIKARQLRTFKKKPQATSRPVPTLSHEDVVSLVDFVDQYTRQFEVAPRTYQKMGEEELRDLLVGMMNANYPGSTTGETFSKLGKIDISMRVDSGNVLVCECKFWSGAKAYGGALDQLFGYLTWRQSYGVLIHFCMLKDMSKAVSEAVRAASGHESFTEESLGHQSETRFTTRHVHPQDTGRALEVFHLFVDLSV